MSKKRTGICHICGSHGALSFEHVPPRSAFNSRAVVLVEFRKAFDLLPGDPTPKGRIQQRGAGGYTLCARCNNSTGAWYGSKFANWCYQAADLLISSGGKPTLAYPYYIYPLEVLKQIVTMFFSINSERFHEVHPELVEFVLNRDRKYLSPRYRVFVYYNVAGQLRAQSVAATMNFEKGQIKTLSEITFPPFGYVLTFNSDPPSNDLYEITHFSRFSYDDFRMMQMQMATLPTHLALPGDYRSIEEIRAQIRRSEALDTDSANARR